MKRPAGLETFEKGSIQVWEAGEQDVASAVSPITLIRPVDTVKLIKLSDDEAIKGFTFKLKGFSNVSI